MLDKDRRDRRPGVRNEITKQINPHNLCPRVLGWRADEWLRTIPEFELTDQHGETHTLATYEQYDYVVFYVQGVGCPIARIALPNYRAVRDEYADKNIGFTMFNSNIQDNLQNAP